MEQIISSKEVLNAFFTAFGNGDFQGILDTFHPDVKVTAVRNAEVNEGSPFGSYYGIEGLKGFLGTLGFVFNTKAFVVENVIDEGNIAFANGNFVHELKTTGKLYKSEWSLMCELKDNKIIAYKFFEDSQKFYEANL